MQKIALFGGSFNPPHKAHRIIAETLSKQFDKVFIIPCGPKYKQSTKDISVHHRAEMVRIAFKGISNIELDFYDLVYGVYTPTYIVDETYKTKYPSDTVYHVIGEDIIAGGHDNCSEIHKIWDKPDYIWNNLNWIVVKRTGYKAKSEDLPPKSIILFITNVMGSGTLIRYLIKQNKSISGLVDSEIEDYIKKNNLFK